MANFNKVILAGNLTRDPQMSNLPSGLPVCEFGLAINRKWKSSQDGQMREETCFVDCKCYGKLAETLSQYMKKGSPLLVEGRLKFDSWEKDGQKRSKLSVVVDNFQFLGGRRDGEESGGGSQRYGRGGGSAPMPMDDAGPPMEEQRDEIPF